MTVCDTAWLAGLLEGEGTFTLQRGIYPEIRLGMTDRDVVVRAARLLGGRGEVRRYPLRRSHIGEREICGYRPMYYFCMAGHRAVALLRTLRPYMGQRRRARIAQLLRAYKSVKRG